MRVKRFFAALWANKFLILGLIVLYAGMVSASYALRSERPKRAKVPPMDVVFVFDATGSMQDDIEALLRTSSRFASVLASSGSDYRLAMVTFGAIEDGQVIRETFESSNNVAAFQSFLRQVVAAAGGTEDQPTAMKYAISHFKYRPGAKKILILVTDEELQGAGSLDQSAPPPTREWEQIIQTLVGRKFTAYAVCQPEEPFMALARRTGGKFYDITGGHDFTDILMGIAEDINASITR